MSKFTCIVLCVVAASLTKVSAVTDEEKEAFRQAMAPVIAACSEEHGVSEGDIKAATENRDPDAVKPCFLGCVLKKTGVLDSKGLYDEKNGLAQLKNFVKSKEDVEKFEQIGKTCSSVNDEAVSDGEAGCERAKLLLSCAIKHNVEVPI